MFILYFLIQCKNYDLALRIAMFHYLLKFINSRNESWWVHITHRSLDSPSSHPVVTSPDSFSKWKEWFWIEIEGEDWANFFRPNFYRAINDNTQNIKLSVDDKNAIEVLPKECSHFLANLISEPSLHKPGLSPLGPQTLQEKQLSATDNSSLLFPISKTIATEVVLGH